MAANNDEERRFILWNISRVVSPPARGPNIVRPVATGPTRSSTLYSVLAIVDSFVNSVLANPRKMLVRSSIVVALLAITTMAAQQLMTNVKIAKVFVEIDRVGGELFPNHPSRIVFRDPDLSASDVQNLIPYLSTIPAGQDIVTKLSPCRALDFTSTPRITESEVAELIQHLDQTIVFYYNKNGEGRCAQTDDLRQRMAVAHGLTGAR